MKSPVFTTGAVADAKNIAIRLFFECKTLYTSADDSPASVPFPRQIKTVSNGLYSKSVIVKKSAPISPAIKVIKPKENPSNAPAVTPSSAPPKTIGISTRLMEVAPIFR